MRAGAERLERYTLLRDSKLWTCRRATAALCEFVIAECSGTALERMRDGFHSEKYLGDLSWFPRSPSRLRLDQAAWGNGGCVPLSCSRHGKDRSDRSRMPEHDPEKACPRATTRWVGTGFPKKI